MTHFALYAIDCDWCDIHGDDCCDAGTPATANTVEGVREQARKLGWTRVNDSDFCPLHSLVRAALAVGDAYAKPGQEVDPIISELVYAAQTFRLIHTIDLTKDVTP